MPPTPTPGTNFVVWLIVLVAVGFVMMVLFKVAVWWGEQHPMSSEDEPPMPVRGGSRTGSHARSAGFDNAVLARQSQVEPQEPLENEPDEKSYARQLAREELIITLAVQRKDNGEYIWSANQITAFVGGAAAPIKATIATVRGKKETPPPLKSLNRPVNGW